MVNELYKFFTGSGQVIDTSEEQFRTAITSRPDILDTLVNEFNIKRQAKQDEKGNLDESERKFTQNIYIIMLSILIFIMTWRFLLYIIIIYAIVRFIFWIINKFKGHDY